MLQVVKNEKMSKRAVGNFSKGSAPDFRKFGADPSEFEILVVEVGPNNAVGDFLNYFGAEIPEVMAPKLCKYF